MKRAVEVVAVLLGVFFAVVGLMKLLDVPRLADAYRAAGQPRWVFFASGAAELLGGLGLCIERTRRRAAWFLLGMIFVVAWAPWKTEELFFLVPQVLSISVLLAVVVVTRRQRTRL